MRLAENSQHSFATSTGSVRTLAPSPEPTVTDSIAPRGERSMTALMSRFAAARSLFSCARAVVAVDLSRLVARRLPWTSSRATRSDSRRPFTESSRRSSSSAIVATRMPPPTSSSRSRDAAAHSDRQTSLMSSRSRVQCTAASLVRGQKPSPTRFEFDLSRVRVESPNVHTNCASASLAASSRMRHASLILPLRPMSGQPAARQ